MTFLAACHHEAGHVWAAFQIHGKTTSVVVIDETFAETRSLFMRDADPEDLATYLLAGGAAQRAAGFAIDHRDSHHDERRALAIARTAAWPDLSAAMDQVAEGLLARAERRAHGLVLRYDREIRHVAATLAAASGRLAGPEVAAAIRSALRNADPDPHAWRRSLPTQTDIVAARARAIRRSASRTPAPTPSGRGGSAPGPSASGGRTAFASDVGARGAAVSGSIVGLKPTTASVGARLTDAEEAQLAFGLARIRGW